MMHLLFVEQLRAMIQLLERQKRRDQFPVNQAFSLALDIYLPDRRFAHFSQTE